MGHAAREAARTWTMQEHAGRLAATAGPRDYVGQLRALYDDVTRRWRYVMETGERVPGSARAVLGHVLGARYNLGPHCPSPEQCDLARTPWRSRGWGDCDDVATLTAAGVLALGMVPAFRVVRWRGGAHVAVVATTPKGERVSVDPVGHPDHAFGWAADGDAQEFDLDGRPAGGTMDGGGVTRTWFAGPMTGVRVGTKRPHVVLVAGNDDRGARVLAMPEWVARLFKRGLYVPRATAYDQFGELYEYVSGLDAWAPVHGVRPLGAAEDRQRRRKKRRAAIAKFRKNVARVLEQVSSSKIATFFRKMKSKALRNPLIQRAISTVLQAFGVPAAATRAVLVREASLAERGGRSKLAALAAAGKWREVAKMVGGSLLDGAKGALPGGGLLRAGQQLLQRGMSGYEIDALGELPASAGCRWRMHQGGRVYHVAPVAAMAGERGVYLAGQLEVSDEPLPGRWYRIRKGDNLFSVCSRAYGVKPGPARLAVAQWVNAAKANRCLHTDQIPAKEREWFDGSRISFNPTFACSREEQERCTPGVCFGLMWLPPAPGVEPPLPPDPDEPAPVPEPDDPPPAPEPDEPEQPDTPPDDPPPAPPDDPSDDDPDPPIIDIPPEPEPEPDEPPAPPEPDDPPPAPPEPDEPPLPEPDDPDPEPPPDPTPPAPSRGLGLALLLMLAAGGRG